MFKRIGIGMLVVSLAAFMMAGCKKKSEAPTETAPAASAPAPAPSDESKEMSDDAKEMSGEALFQQNCAVCHPDGGNIVKPDKTLHKKALAASGIVKPKDIVKIMRNPGPGMTKFDEATISDEDAKKIGKYILQTFE